MKPLIFVVLMIFPFSTYAVEFHQCIDDKGRSHFTNLSKSSLDSNCRETTDHYSFMLNQDYLRLANELNKVDEIEEEPGSDETMLSIDSITQPVMDLLDPDKALDELVESSSEHDNTATKFFKARTKAIEQILNEAKPNTPPNDT